jgi:hypothetical protein
MALKALPQSWSSVEPKTRCLGEGVHRNITLVKFELMKSW